MLAPAPAAQQPGRPAEAARRAAYAAAAAMVAPPAPPGFSAEWEPPGHSCVLLFSRLPNIGKSEESRALGILTWISRTTPGGFTRDGYAIFFHRYPPSDKEVEEFTGKMTKWYCEYWSQKIQKEGFANPFFEVDDPQRMALHSARLVGNHHSIRNPV